MAITRDDRVLTDAQGRALAGAQVYWCLQPTAVGSVPPPANLATIYTDITGTTPETQPFITDGFGHAWAYMDNGPLYTLVFYHPLFGSNPVVWPDQRIGGSGGGGSTVTPFSGTPQGTIDGTNITFTVVNGSTPLTTFPAQIEVWQNFSLINGIGFFLSMVGGQLKVTYAQPPQPASGSVPADKLWAQGYILS